MDCALTVAEEDFRNNPLPDVVADVDVARGSDEPRSVLVDILKRVRGLVYKIDVIPYLYLDCSSCVTKIGVSGYCQYFLECREVFSGSKGVIENGGEKVPGTGEMKYTQKISTAKRRQSSRCKDDLQSQLQGASM